MIRKSRILIMVTVLAACALALSQCIIVPSKSAASRPSSSQAAVAKPAPSKPIASQPDKSPPPSQSRKIIYERGKTHQISGVVRVIKGGYQIEDDKSDTLFIFINLSRVEAQRFQKMVGKRMQIRLKVVSGENTRSISSQIVGFID
jgi:hypothetical protein